MRFSPSRPSPGSPWSSLSGALSVPMACAVLALTSGFSTPPADFLGSGTGPAASSGPTDEIADLVEEILAAGDSGQVEPIQRLANLKTSAALDALMEVFGKLDSVFMRRAVLQGVVLFDGVSGQEQRAVQFLTDAATQSKDRDLRLAAVDLIGRCRNFGRSFLALLVESPADDEVREEALKRHAGSPSDGDFDWYRDLWQGRWRQDASGSGASGGRGKKGKKGKKRGRDKDEETDAAPRPRPLESLREIAFEAVVPKLDIAEVVRATGDRSPKIRVRAIQELEARGDTRAESMLESLLGASWTLPADRLYAATALLRSRGVEFADDLIKLATRKAQSELFALGVADLLDGLDDPGIDKKILKKLGKGKGLERLFWLRAARGLEDPKVDKVLIKLIKDKDARVARTALSYIAARRMFDASEDLDKFVTKAKDPELIAEALETLTVLRKGDPEWVDQLVLHSQSEDRSIRNAALGALAAIKDPKASEALLIALGHTDWSTRLVAVKALEERRRPEAVGPLIARLPEENGRLADEIADALFSLTGQHYRTNFGLWERWWKDSEDGFKVVSKAELRKLVKAEEERRLRQVTRTEFFGVKIQSNRVIFILDVSGSMLEPTLGRYSSEAGKPRITVAKKELIRVINGLDRRSFFNMIVFSDGAFPWADTITPYDAESVQDAKEFVGRLGAQGGTNLYAALALAFEDPEVDTIYVLSDGEPTVGSVIDPASIRDRVAQWNRNRGIVIHTIAVGGNLRVLEWLAQDTGGKHVRIP